MTKQVQVQSSFYNEETQQKVDIFAFCGTCLVLAIAKGPNRQLDGLPTSFSGLCHQQLMFSADQIEKFENSPKKVIFVDE